MRTTDNSVSTPAGFDFSEIYVNHRKRVAPDNPYFAMGAFGSTHPGGANLVFADGHVDFISEDLDLATYTEFGTRASQELDPNDYLPATPRG